MARFRLQIQMVAVTASPKATEWVKPIPGHPRCHWCGTVALKCRPPIVMPYTQNFDRKSGRKSPAATAQKLTRPRIRRGRWPWNV